MLTRRACLGIAAVFAVPAIAEDAGPASTGRLNARPAAMPPLPGEFRAGENNYLGIDTSQPHDAVLYAPKSFAPAAAMPLLVMLHGSGESALSMTEAMAPFAEAHSFLLLVPKSRGATWDLHHAPACEDAAIVDAALARTFSLVQVDPKHIALAGMSDGASFALSLGLANGDLFRDLLIFSAGFFHTGARIGKPRIFVSHGHRDRILPFALGRRIVATLAGAGYDVTFRDFDGGHEMPRAGLDEALTRFLS